MFLTFRLKVVNCLRFVNIFFLCSFKAVEDAFVPVIKFKFDGIEVSDFRMPALHYHKKKKKEISQEKKVIL